MRLFFMAVLCSAVSASPKEFRFSIYNGSEMKVRPYCEGAALEKMEPQKNQTIFCAGSLMINHIKKNGKEIPFFSNKKIEGDLHKLTDVGVYGKSFRFVRISKRHYRLPRGALASHFVIFNDFVPVTSLQVFCDSKDLGIVSYKQPLNAYCQGQLKIKKKDTLESVLEIAGNSPGLKSIRIYQDEQLAWKTVVNDLDWHDPKMGISAMGVEVDLKN